MEVKKIIGSALKILGRNSLAADVEDGAVRDAEGRETVDTLLYCFNAVEDEVARKYVPLSAKEELKSFDGKYYYSSFSHPPVTVKKVRADGKEIAFELMLEYLFADADKITVEYTYAPTGKSIDGESDFGAESCRMHALGTASEYCFINGEIEAAELWEKKYRGEIDGLQRSLPECGSIPPRRWV